MEGGIFLEKMIADVITLISTTKNKHEEAKNESQLITYKNSYIFFSTSFRFHVTLSKHRVSLTFCINLQLYQNSRYK